MVRFACSPAKSRSASRATSSCQKTSFWNSLCKSRTRSSSASLAAGWSEPSSRFSTRSAQPKSVASPSRRWSRAK